MQQDLVGGLRALLRQAPAGWQAACGRHGLHLGAPDIEAELARALVIDWTDPRVADLCRLTTRAIEPGDPARSLLYHLLAAPELASSGIDVSLAQLDDIENYIYWRGWQANPPDDVAQLEPCVLAYQYRPARRTGHRMHADMVYSRLGIARNGDTDASFDPISRGYTPDAGDKAHVRVMPARYGLFLVRRQHGARGLAPVEGRKAGDAERDFLAPVCKLFAGLPYHGTPLPPMAFVHRHRCDKLKRATQARIGFKPPKGVDLDAPPFTVQWGTNSFGSAIQLQTVGASALVMPQPQPLIEAVAAPTPGMDGFRVPQQCAFVPQINRRFSTLRLVTNLGELALGAWSYIAIRCRFPKFTYQWLGHYPEPRNAPEYVHIRHVIKEDGRIANMLTAPANRDDFLTRVSFGGYRAQFFVDHSSEGVITATLPGTHRPVLPAYSIVAAPDFFPYADQSELGQWFREARVDPKTQFRNGSPSSLSNERLPANPAHVDPLTGQQAFDRRDTTIAVTFSLAARTDAHAAPVSSNARLVSFLSDASSNVFAPGWDITYASDSGGVFLATYGLGSPFPEDIKLCAASNSFWPAVSPDASRTFNRSDAPTAIPMLDDELGIDPGHPLVRQHLATTQYGWDGEYGPYLTDDGLVDYADIERSDYVANALAGRMLFGALQHLDAAELIRRIRALRFAVAACEPGKTPASTTLWLVSARQVPSPANLAQSLYRFLFVLPTEVAAQPSQTTPGRLRIPYRRALCCEASATQLFGTVRDAEPGPAAVQLYF